jgi:hypothetical protein
MLRFRIIAWVAGRPGCPSKPFTEQGVVKGIILTSRNLARSAANRVSIKTEPFAPESTNVEV